MHLNHTLGRLQPLAVAAETVAFAKAGVAHLGLAGQRAIHIRRSEQYDDAAIANSAHLA